MSELHRTLDELCFRYKTDPKIRREVYVEGIQDKLIIDHLIRRWGLNIAVYTANTVKIPYEMINQYGLEFPSARSTVIATRQCLLEKGVAVENHVFLVDRDLEDLVPTPVIDGCLVTDHGCLVASFLNDDLLERLTGVVGRGVIDVGIFWHSLCAVSNAIFGVRVVAKENAIPLRIISPAGFVKGGRANGFELAIPEYVRACAASGGVRDKADEIIYAVGECLARIKSLAVDPRCLMNDHDLWVIIKVILKASGDQVNRSADDIRDLVLMGAHGSVFEGTSLDLALRGVRDKNED